jgi:hypothetical protein
MQTAEGEKHAELRNRWVHFRVRDVYIPDPQKVLVDLYGDHLLQGRVRELSESDDDSFAVVEVEGIEMPVIIALDRILGVL